MPRDRPRVLIVDDERPIRRLLAAALADAYDVTEAESGEEGLRRAAADPPDLVVLDLGLPDLDGCEVLRRLREWSTVPVLVLSARGQEVEKVAALDAGADDYLTKPFGMAELQARIRAAVRRAQQTTGPGSTAAIRVGDLVIDLAARRVRLAGEELALTPIEYRLLTTMARHHGKVLTHRFLLGEVWGRHYVDQVHSLRVFVAALRRKLHDDPAAPRFVVTEQGVGYRFADAEG